MPKILGGLSTDGLVDAGLGFRHGSSSTPSWTTGIGAPEGAITAAIGSLYSRLDGGADTALYRKEEAGAAGWVALSSTGGAVESVDGRTGVVTLDDLYVDVTGDVMTGSLQVGDLPTGTLIDSTGRVSIGTWGSNPFAYLTLGNPGSTVTSTDPIAAIEIGITNRGSGDVIGVDATPSYWGNSTTYQTATGVRGGVALRNSSFGRIANAVALSAASVDLDGGFVTNAYGLDIQAQANTKITNAYGIYQHGPDDINHFAGVIQSPTGYRFGDDTTPSWTSGTGTPEGAVTAPVGSLFSRTDGATDTAIYRKEAGTDNTGWIAVAAGGVGGVTSVNGQTGDVTLHGEYVNASGDTMTGTLAMVAATDTDDVLTASITGDLYPRLTANADGSLEWGRGSVPSAASISFDTSATNERIKITAPTGMVSSATQTTVMNSVSSGSFGMTIDLAADSATAMSGWTGVGSSLIKTGAGNFTGTGSMQTGNFSLFNTGAGNVTSAIATAVNIQVQQTSTGTFSEVRALRIRPLGGSGTGVITSATGASIEWAGHATRVTSSVGLSVAAQSAVTTAVTAQFGASATRTLWVGSDTNPTTAAGGITFGSSADTTLYRSAAGVLTTDGTFTSGATVQAAQSTTAGGFRHGAAGPIWVSGNNTPESVVAAPIGSLYSRMNGVANATLYRKESGTGTTGWVAVTTVTTPVTSVDGRTGVVTLSDLYVNVTGDTMTGQLHAPVLSLGNNPALNGPLRLTNSDAIWFRNAANSNDIQVLTLLSTDFVQVGGTGYAGTAVATGNSRTLWVSSTSNPTNAAGGIYFGSAQDTNLYRSGTATLRTNSTLKSDVIIEAALSATAGGFRHGPSGPTWVAGTGAPEGVVTAPIGSLFSRTDGTIDTALYRKEGTGNTGWTAVAASTAGVTSVDGRTGAVVLSDLYVNTTGDTMTGDLLVNANLSAGAAKLNVGERFSVSEATSHTSSFGTYAIRSQTAWTSSVDATSTVIGALIMASANIAAGATLTSGGADAVYVIQGRGTVGGDGTLAIGGASAVIGTIQKTGTSTLSNSHALVAATPTISGGAITNAVGVDVRTQGVAGVTNAYGVWVAAQSLATNNYGIAIGASATSTLWVSSNTNSTTAAGGIHFGSSRDTALYRSAVGTLNVTGSLITSGGITPGGSISVPYWDSLPVTNSTTMASPSGAGNAIGMPPFVRSWHDVLRFNAAGTPTEETLVGSTWTSRSLTTSLFDGRESAAVTLIDGTTATAVRWTWSTTFATSMQWLRMAFGYNVPTLNIAVDVEQSTDGVTWTPVVMNATSTAANSADLWLRTGGVSNTAWSRVTIRSTNAQPIKLATLQWYTARSGDQGLGTYIEYPYAWNASKQMALNNATPGSGPLTLGTNAMTTPATNGLWWGTDTNLYRSAVDTLSTDSNFVVNGNLNVNGQSFFDATGTHTSGGGPLGARIRHLYSSAVDTTAYIAGGSSAVIATLPAGVTHSLAASEAIVGFNGSVTAQGDGNYSTHASGVMGSIVKNGTGTLLIGRGFLAYGPTVYAGTITNAYGVDIYTQKITGVTNGYGVYQRGAADLNYFAGKVGIGVVALTNVGLTMGGTNTDWGIYQGTMTIAPADNGTAFFIGAGGIVGTGTANTIAVANGLAATAMTKSGTGTVTNAYGINVSTQTIGTTRNVGIRVDASSTAALWLSASSNSTTIAGGILFGSSGDASLYRSAANTLTTGNLDLAKNELQNAVTHKLAAAPASPVEGQRYYDTVMKLERYYNGTAWVSAGTGVPNTGWSASGHTADKSFVATSTTVNELANVLATLIEALKTSGILA
jgi:hypothetical protein